MKNLFSILSILTFLSVANAQLSNVSTKDSICGHKINRDKNGYILPWYKPEIPGAGYDKVIRLAAEFIKSGTPVESKTGLKMYLVTCCFQGPHSNPEKKFIAEQWAHNPACVYAGIVQSLAVGYYNYTGDNTCISVVAEMLDYQLQNGTTPVGWIWEKVPYASADPFNKIYEGAKQWEIEDYRGDGLHVIEPDKVGELGYAYLRFYEITNEQKYLDAAISCADALSKHVRDLKGDASNFAKTQIKKSPWPFRVNARTGMVISEYCSNMVDPVKLFDELIRIQGIAKLDIRQVETYKKARQLAWDWLYSRNGPIITGAWNGYFEDIPNDPDVTNRLQITPMELAKYLIAHPEMDRDIDKTVPALIHWVRTAFKTDGMDAIKEQTWCYEPMGSHTARYASVCALWYERTKDEWYKDQAYRHFNFATYMTYENGVVAVGPTWLGSWFSDGYSDYIRHYFDGFAAIPEWAPASEDHLIKSSSVIKNISYNVKEICFSTYDENAVETFKLIAKPKAVTANKETLKESKNIINNSWTWQPLGKGGILKINHLNGNEIVLKY